MQGVLHGLFGFLYPPPQYFAFLRQTLDYRFDNQAFVGFAPLSILSFLSHLLSYGNNCGCIKPLTISQIPKFYFPISTLYSSGIVTPLK
jgi:hypothetical protein